METINSCNNDEILQPSFAEIVSMHKQFILKYKKPTDSFRCHFSDWKDNLEIQYIINANDCSSKVVKIGTFSKDKSRRFKDILIYLVMSSLFYEITLYITVHQQDYRSGFLVFGGQLKADSKFINTLLI